MCRHSAFHEPSGVWAARWKNEGESGGWILGIRDTGTREKPITIDHEEEERGDEDQDSDAEMEEVQV